MSLSLGTNFSRKGTTVKMAILLMVIFSLMESVGIAIGLGISDANELVGTVILSIAGGTFIYIACSEIIIEEFSKAKYKVVKWLMFIFGAAIICLLWFTEAD